MSDARRSPAKPSHRRGPRAAISKVVDVTAPTVMEPPDDCSWSGLDDAEASAPYETYESAQTARDAISEEGVAPGAADPEAERRLGGADGIGVERDAPTEGQPPHLRED